MAAHYGYQNNPISLAQMMADRLGHVAAKAPSAALTPKQIAAIRLLRTIVLWTINERPWPPGGMYAPADVRGACETVWPLISEPEPPQPSTTFWLGAEATP